MRFNDELDRFDEEVLKPFRKRRSGKPKRFHPEVARAIRQMSEGEILKLFELGKRRLSVIQSQLSQHFEVGERVEFNGRKDALMSGRIVKCNPKRARIVTESHEFWNVPYSQLQKISNFKD